MILTGKKISIVGVGSRKLGSCESEKAPPSPLHPLFEKILRPLIEATRPKGQNMEEPTCFKCGKKASEITEYIDACEKWQTPGQYVRSEEGTYNPRTNHFCCTRCYIDIGMPSRPGGGWKAP